MRQSEVGFGQVVRQKVTGAVHALWRMPPLWVAILGISLALPALSVDLVLDDFRVKDSLLALLEGRQAETPWWKLGIQLDGDVGATLYKRTVGMLPWWVLPEIRVAFLRPLMLFPHLLDFALWPNAVWAMHLQSVLWYGLVCAMACLLYLKVASRSSVAVLASVLYAVEDMHSVPIAWISARSNLVSACLAYPALLAYLRWRRDGWRTGAWLAPLGMFVALLAAEKAVCILGFFVAVGLSFDRAPLGRRAASLLPTVSAVVLWRLGYDALGFGAYGSGFYVDPTRQPGQFLQVLPDRLSTLLAWQFGLPAPLLLELEGIAASVLGWAVLLVVAAGVVGLLLLHVRRDPEVRFWAIGSALSLIPMASASSGEQMLFMSGLGAAALLAHLIVAAVGALSRMGSMRRALLLGVVAVASAAHLVAAPIYLSLGTYSVGRSLFNMGLVPAAILGQDPVLEGQCVAVVHAPSCLHGLMIPFERWRLGMPNPRHLWVLGSGYRQSVEVLRPDENSIELSAEGGYLIDPLAVHFRGAGHPFVPGDQIRLLNHTVTVRDITEDGRPLRIVVRFDVALPHPLWRLIVWTGEDYAEFRLPNVGEKVLLKDGKQGPVSDG